MPATLERTVTIDRNLARRAERKLHRYGMSLDDAFAKTLAFVVSTHGNPWGGAERAMPSVIEFDFGDADGMTKEQLRQTYPEFYRMYVLNEDRGHSTAPGGESLEQVYCRVRDGILRIAREHQGSTIVIASHGTAIQTFLNFASGIPWQEMKHFLLYNVSVSCVEIDPNGRPHIVFIGDRRHMPENLAFCYARQGK